jgi:hypothetical protein
MPSPLSVTHNMDNPTKSGAHIEMAIPIRVRGMSVENKFFDEETETKLVGLQTLVTRLQNLVELETEVHVVNLESMVGGTFRVVWVNTVGRDGFHNLGLELSQTEGDLWKVQFGNLDGDAGQTEGWIECLRCHQRLKVPVPQARAPFFVEGFQLSRPCDRCKATTSWAFSTDPATEAAGGGQGPAARKRGIEMRRKGRVPLKMQIKLVRASFGYALEDVCTTLNVSRGGACFVSPHPYAVGETLKVYMPYKEGELGIPVPARVVRRDPLKGSPHHAIAIQLQEAQ